MGKPLDVPWDKIRETCEKGTRLSEVAKLFGISDAAIRMRSNRERWNTPNRVNQRLNQAAEVQNARVAKNLAMESQLKSARLAENLSITATGAVDFDKAVKDYRSKGVVKLAKLLDQTIIAPPRSWKDYDIADKMMRRLLGIDEGENKSNTIVQLQVVNERLRENAPHEDIIEGELVEESVPNLSPAA